MTISNDMIKETDLLHRLTVSSILFFVAIPIFSNPQNSVTATEGDTITLTCSATALPIPTLTLLSPANETISSENSTASYSFAVNNTYDKAVYLCRATNPAGTRYYRTVLDIRCKLTAKRINNIYSIQL